jgi:hypothetical protein
MKANPNRTWYIILRGRQSHMQHIATFTGTIEEVLQEADVLECHVRWQVISVAIHAQPSS